MKDFFVIIFLLFALQVFGKDDYKFGKVNINELEEKYYKEDSLAGAVVLYNIGETETVINSISYQFNTLFTKRKKIKIYDKNSLSFGNQTLVLLNSKYSENDISLYGVKGKTYNLENNKIVEYDLPKSAIRVDRLDDYHDIVHIVFNNVKVGSILEYEIKINIPGVAIPDWYFQEQYPVKYSQFSIDMAEFFNLRESSKGYLQIPIPELDGRKEVIHNFSYRVNYKTWKMKDIPAFVEEPFIYSANNFISQLNHELLSVKFPDRIEESITTNWNEINKLLLENKYFGQQLNNSTSFLNAHYNNLKEIKDDVERMKACFTTIQKSMSWNQYENFQSLSIKEAFKETVGSSGDINLLLLRLLKECNIEVYPVLLSTRAYGFVPFFPSLNKFNYVIALAKINGQSYLLDATDKHLPPNMLPERCLNGKGFIVKQDNVAQWIDLNPTQNNSTLNFTEFTIDEIGKISGKSTYKRTGYAAYDIRKSLTNSSMSNNFDWIVKNASNDVEIKNYTLTNKDSTNLPLIENFEFKTDILDIKGKKTILLEPVFFEKIVDNPFKMPNRLLPIEFPSPIEKSYIINISLPDNLVIEDKPKSVNINIPDNTAKFSYQINVISNSIQIVAKLNIKNIRYSQNQYPYLKEFYAQVISKLNEPILLYTK